MKKDNKKTKMVKKGLINYPIGDFMIRVKNAAKAGKKEIVAGNTKFIRSIAELMKKHGYLETVQTDGEGIVVKLAFKSKEPVVMDVKLISTPGLRVYASYHDLAKIRKPSRIIVSTPSGVMFSNEAVKKNLGGELIAEIL